MNDNLVLSRAPPTRESCPVSCWSQAPYGCLGAGILIALIPWEAVVGSGVRMGLAVSQA